MTALISQIINSQDSRCSAWCSISPQLSPAGTLNWLILTFEWRTNDVFRKENRGQMHVSVRSTTTLLHFELTIYNVGRRDLSPRRQTNQKHSAAPVWPEVRQRVRHTHTHTHSQTKQFPWDHTPAAHSPALNLFKMNSLCRPEWKPCVNLSMFLRQQAFREVRRTK